MFHKPPLKTYVGKKSQAKTQENATGSHLIANSLNRIVREDIPPDREFQPTEYTNFNDKDETLDYDPFDTTFDRLLKEARLPPPPSDRTSHSSYENSSSDAMNSKNTSSDEELVAPFVELKSQPKQRIAGKRRNAMAQKISKYDTTMTNDKSTRKIKLRTKVKNLRSFKDENLSPNDEYSPITSGSKKNKKASTKQPTVDSQLKKSKIRVRESRENNNIGAFPAIKQCSVSLHRLPTSLVKSVALDSRGSGDKIRKTIRMTETLEQESKKRKKSIEAWLNDNSTSSSNDPPAKLFTSKTITGDEKIIMDSLKNPTVKLPRLKAKRLFIDKFSSSTPIGPRATSAKSLLRLSPIMNNMIDEIDENDHFEATNVSRKSTAQGIDPVPSTSTSILSTEKSIGNKLGKSTKRLLQVLSDTPDSDPSELLFSDTDAIMGKSSSLSFTEKHSHETDASMTEKESPSRESFHLTYEDSPDENIEVYDINEPVSSYLSPKTQKKELSHASPLSSDNDVHARESSVEDDFVGFPNVQVGREEHESQKLDDDDDWSTVTGSLNTTGEKSVPETGKTVDPTTSSKNISRDDISGSVESHSKIEIEGEKLKQSIAAKESSNVEFEDLMKENKTTVMPEENVGEKNVLPPLQPIVLLSKLKIPMRTSRSLENIDESSPEKSSDPSNSVLELTTDNETKSFSQTQRPINPLELFSKKMELEIGSDVEDSLVEMQRSNVIEFSKSAMEVEKETILETFANDSASLDGSANESEILDTNMENFVDDSASLDASVNKNEMLDENMEKSVIELLPKQDKICESSLNKSNITMTRSMDMKERHALAEEASPNSKQPVVLLSRLRGQYGITQRSKKYRNWNLGMSAILENHDPKDSKAIDECSEKVENISNSYNTDTSGSSEQLKTKPSGRESRVSSQTRISQVSMDTVRASGLSDEHESTGENKVVFLRPGKSWARSLSILSQVHSQDDLESLSVGKGKKWRESVQHLFEMQPQGLIQSCVKKNEDDKVSRSQSGVRNSTISAWIPGSSQPNTSKLLDIASPGRFVRRVSIRVVPDGRSFNRIADTSFLEAYGITQTEDRKTSERRTVIAPRITSVYNVTNGRPSCIDDLKDPQRSLESLKPREVVLAQCGQQSSLSFDECYPKSYLENCRKIGEGVFGEVFLYQKNNIKIVIKIIPIEGDLKINGERQKKFDEILSEIVIAKQLHNLRFDNKSKTSSFVEVNNVRCVVGKYPDTLIRLWNEYDEEKNSENDSPSIFDENQLYIVLELGHGGEDLEAFVFHNSTEAHALFIQTAFALAVAEESHEFEHRDLHWGNLLISRTDDTQIDFKLGGKSINVTTKGVKVSVIDFTLSRMSYQGCSIFNDLSLDDDLFVAQGEYQFDIYRLMKQKVENNWQRFEPYTNILWLHYILDKMITAVRYRRTASKIHRSGIAKLQELKDEILDYKSCVDFVTNCDRVVRLRDSRSSISTVKAMD